MMHAIFHMLITVFFLLAETTERLEDFLLGPAPGRHAKS